MANSAKDTKKIEEAILARAHRRGLSASLEGIRYANQYVYGNGASAKEALYVGVGHGLDALLALSDSYALQITGVDPYISSHGNDDEDYETLCSLISDLDLEGRFRLFRGIIQDYQPGKGPAPDLIIINDVLHHIYETQLPLRKSDLFDEAVAMFSRLKELAAPQARLVIGDVSRNGLRPLLGHLGVLHPWIEFATKQNWREWDAAALQAGWSRSGISNYTPYRFRSLAPLFCGPIARYTLCDKYYLYYRS